MTPKQTVKLWRKTYHRFVVLLHINFPSPSLFPHFSAAVCEVPTFRDNVEEEIDWDQFPLFAGKAMEFNCKSNPMVVPKGRVRCDEDGRLTRNPCRGTLKSLEINNPNSL